MPRHAPENQPSTRPTGLIEAHWWLVDSGAWANLSNVARAIIVPILRKTAGWSKESEQLSLSWLAHAGSIERARVPAALRELQELGIIAVEKPQHRGQPSTIRLTLDVAKRRMRPQLSMQTRIDAVVPPEHHPEKQGSAVEAPDPVPSEHHLGALTAPNKRSPLNEAKKTKDERRPRLSVVPSSSRGPKNRRKIVDRGWIREALRELNGTTITARLSGPRLAWLVETIDPARLSAGFDEPTTAQWMRWAAEVTARHVPPPNDPWAYFLGVLTAGIAERDTVDPPRPHLRSQDPDISATRYGHIYQ